MEMDKRDGMFAHSSVMAVPPFQQMSRIDQPIPLPAGYGYPPPPPAYGQPYAYPPPPQYPPVYPPSGYPGPTYTPVGYPTAGYPPVLPKQKGKGHHIPNCH